MHVSKPSRQVRAYDCPVVARQIGETEHPEADHDETVHREPLVDLRELSLELGRAAERDHHCLTPGLLPLLLVLHEVHDRWTDWTCPSPPPGRPDLPRAADCGQ